MFGVSAAYINAVSPFMTTGERKMLRYCIIDAYLSRVHHMQRTIKLP